MYRLFLDINNMEAFYASYRKLLLNKIRSCYKDSTFTSNEHTKRFLKEYAREGNLHKLICANIPEQIKIAAKWVDAVRMDYQFHSNLKYIFIQNGYNQIDKSKFIADLNLKVCPYCGRAYISQAVNPTTGKAYNPQIDHFLPASIYPFFAMTYMNLIPCCITCNSFQYKGGFDPVCIPRSITQSNNYVEFLMNPYMFDTDKISFTFEIAGLDLTKSDSYVVNTIFKDLYERGYNYKLGLGFQYAKHNDLVRDDVIKSFLYYSALPNLYKGSFGIDVTSIKFFAQCVFGFESDSSHDGHRVMSKFHREIHNHILYLIQLGKKST